MALKKTKTIVFIHGLFMNPLSWKPWVTFFEGQGYHCYAPSYPFHDGLPADLKQNIHPDLGTLTFAGVIHRLCDFLDQLPEKPILIGHSMGGLAVQKLIEMNKGLAGICIDSAPPKGVFSFTWSFLKANIPTINPFKGDSVCYPDVSWFHYAFCHTMSLKETQAAYDTWVVPESRNIPRSSSGTDGKIDFSKPHAPLLFIAGELDKIIPASLNKKNYSAYRDPTSRRDFVVFAGRTHFICSQPDWEEVALYSINWIRSIQEPI